MCERCVGDGIETATYWPQVSLTIAALLSHSAGLLKWGPEGPSHLTGAGSHYDILSPTTTGTHCLELNSAYLELHLTVAPGNIIVCRPPAFRGRLQRIQPRPKGKDDTPISRLYAPVSWLMARFKVNMLNYLMILYTNPSARAGYDTRSIFKRSLTGFNSEFSFS